MQRAYEPFVSREARDALGDVLGDFFLRERIEDDFVGQPMQAKLVAYRLQRMIGSDDFRDPETAKPLQSRARASSREVIHELHGR